VAIHGHLFAGTAGFEAALCGIPTLLLDREGWPSSPLYDLGVGQVVFTNWDDLWKTYVSHSRKGLPVRGFGDWSTMLDKLDPFRDGRGAERMGEYLEWILAGLKEGLGRETAMADAAERYTRIWGHDKVRSSRRTVAKAMNQ
jgi:hypothetical protein